MLILIIMWKCPCKQLTVRYINLTRINIFSHWRRIYRYGENSNCLKKSLLYETLCHLNINNTANIAAAHCVHISRQCFNAI